MKHTDEQCIEVAVTYFRDAIIAIGRHSIKANEKHSPGQPIHWNRNQSKDQWGSWGRHLSALGTIDEETGSPHHVPWAWRTLAIVQLYLEANKKQYAQSKLHTKSNKSYRRGNKDERN